MNEVRLDLEKYDSLQQYIQSKNARIDALEKEIEQLKADHEAELDTLANEGKVKIIQKPYSVFVCMLAGKEPPVEEYKGFEDVKSEVYEHFKQGLFDEELEKHKQEQLDSLIKQLSEKATTIDDLKVKVRRLHGRNLWQRIRNK